MLRTRRRFLGMCGAVGVSAGFAPGAMAGLVSPAALGDYLRGRRRGGGLRLEDLQKVTFEPLLNSTFEVSNDAGGRARLKLIEVAGRDSDPKLDQFSLLFEAPADLILGQGTYWFEHSALGRQPLFLVPVGPSKTGGRLYESVFCRLIG